MNLVFELLNNLKNNHLSIKNFIYIKATVIKYKIWKFLELKHYIKKVYWIKINNKQYLLINIRKNFTNIKFLNFPIKYKNIFELFFKFKGLFIINTSKGILTIYNAYKLKIGGLLICYIL
uniref:30S ribosomal protein S8 n=1 Tax=Nephromyces sp. ex Molgula occidentalis TaxID=2544991 RepID=A0A5C1H7W1_9APIC|nr:30S ribosomal protein S8 [Nephromyces sp. ex Molgula occidentalis]